MTEPKGPAVLLASGQAPAANSASTIAVWPFHAALMSGVCEKTERKGPIVIPASGRAPAANSASTIAVWPFFAAL